MSKELFQKFSILCLAANLLIVLAIVLLQKDLPPVVPLFYGLPVSQEELTKNIFLVTPALTSSLFICVNFILIRITKDSFLQKIFIGLDATTVALSTITILEIIFLVGKI